MYRCFFQRPLETRRFTQMGLNIRWWGMDCRSPSEWTQEPKEQLFLPSVPPASVTMATTISSTQTPPPSLSIVPKDWQTDPHPFGHSLARQFGALEGIYSSLLIWKERRNSHCRKRVPRKWLSMSIETTFNWYFWEILQLQYIVCTLPQKQSDSANI